MAQSEEIRLEQQVAASPSRVWEALIRPGLWWGEEVTIDPRIGGQFFEPWSDGAHEHRTFGTITEIDPPHLLAMSWKDDDWGFQTRVVITIAGNGNSALISLRHDGWEEAPAGYRPRLISDHRGGWPKHLRNLAACAESMKEKG
jgi:uncharacterized protein YndB with AHSA1/START domain